MSLYRTLLFLFLLAGVPSLSASGVLDYNKPTIQILNPGQNSYTTSEKKVRLVAKINHSEKKYISLYHNGKKIKFKYDSKKGILSKKIKLRKGFNKIDISASNSRGSANEELRIKYYTKNTNSKPKTPPKAKQKPNIQLVAPYKNRITVQQPVFKAKAVIKNLESKSDLQFYQNGKAVAGFKFNPKNKRFIGSVKLLPGKNTFEIRGRNKAGIINERFEIIYDKKSKDLEEEPEEEGEDALRLSMVDYSRKFIGVPYVYAGRSKRGFDCSGFTHHVMKEFDINITPASREQAKLGRKISLKKARPGDLIFFTHNGSTVGHVALVTRNTKEGLFVIHSTSSKGVMEQDILSSSYWKPKILYARNVIP